MKATDLEFKKNDLIVLVSKSVLGVIPHAGALLSEIVGNLIPNQRIDRIAKFVVMLEEKFSQLDQNKIVAHMEHDEYIDLIEEGFVQASRAITDERRLYIASILKNGLNEDAIACTRYKYILGLLKELNDQEIIWLRYYLHPTMGGDEDFRNTHKDVLDRVMTYIGDEEETLEKAAVQESFIEHLERLGLISSTIKLNRETKMPEYDQFTGKPKASYTTITRLGRMVLKNIDIIGIEEDE